MVKELKLHVEKSNALPDVGTYWRLLADGQEAVIGFKYTAPQIWPESYNHFYGFFSGVS